MTIELYELRNSQVRFKGKKFSHLFRLQRTSPQQGDSKIAESWFVHLHPLSETEQAAGKVFLEKMVQLYMRGKGGWSPCRLEWVWQW